MKLYDREISSFNDDEKKISVMGIAFPKFFEIISIYLLNTFNTILLSHYSSSSVAAVNVAAQIINVIVMVICMITNGGSIVLSYELGRKDSKCEKNIAGNALVYSVLIGIILGGLSILFAKHILFYMNVSGQVLIDSKIYFIIRMIGLPITAAMTFFSTFLICYGYVGASFIVSFVSNILNVIFGYLVLYSKLSHYVNCVMGLGIGCVLAQFFSLLIGILLYKKNKCPIAINFSYKSFFRIIRIGVPGNINFLFYNFSQTITTAFIAGMGIKLLELKVYFSNILSYVSVFGYSVAFAGGIIAGRYKGDGKYNEIEKLTKQNLRIAIICNIIFSVIAYICRKQLLLIFTDDVFAFTLATVIWAIDIIIEIARAFNNVFEYSLNAVGDVKITLLTSLISCWGCSVFLGITFAAYLGLGLVGCYIGFMADEIVKTVIYFIRFNSNKWRLKNI